MGKAKVNLSTDNLIDQIETVRFDLNMNPLGIPDSVTKAITNNIPQLSTYPDPTYKQLKESISDYCKADKEDLVIGCSSYELTKLLIEFNSPKKALLVTPGSQAYENLLKLNGCEIIYYNTKEEEDFVLDIADFISCLNEDIDMVFLSNPNCTTSTVIDRESVEFIVKVCSGNDIFLVVDEEYMDFVKDKDECTSIPLVSDYDNIAILRNTTKFFAVPGLRLSYLITSNIVFKKTLEIAGFPYSISKLAEAAGIDMFKDASYISDSNSVINTERNLVFAALSVHKSIKLYKPAANFILIKLLKDDMSAQDVADYLVNKGLYIRNCSDIMGLSNKYIRICFMNPKQNDLLVNTLLEFV